MAERKVVLTVPAQYAGWRLDQALAELVPDCTRARIQHWITEGHVRLDGKAPRKRERLAGGETVSLEIPVPPPTAHRAQELPLAIVYEDDDLLVVNKPAGLVVHPGAGNPEGTLLNALLYHVPALATLPRAGIVHRLDKDTSGLLVVAKNERARQYLVGELKEREIERDYVAIVHGVPVSGATIEAPIGRHRHDRKRMAVVTRGKPAITHFRILRRYRAHTLLQVKLESGRTHQIRVHLAHVNYPILGDPVYGGRPRVPRGCSPALRDLLRGFRRQALHAAKLSLNHPTTGERMQWSASVPEDMSMLMAALAEDAREHHE